jgi:hypothetical protein
MRIRRDYQAACPACHARPGSPCKGKQGERLPGVHYQRIRALRAEALAAFKALYSPPPRNTLSL